MKNILKGVAVVAMASVTLMTVGCEEDDQVNKPVANAESQMSNYGNSSNLARSQEKFPAFTTVDINGNSITNDIFANKKITAVNIWGTFCPPCIAEMPDLGRWAKNMPKDAQLIGIVCDVDGAYDSYTIEAAKEILNDSNANFLNIVPNESIMRYLENVEAVPTTIFVDSEGYILSEKVVGADVDEYKNIVGAYLHE